MSITATQLKENLSKYLAIALDEDVYISKNGKIIAKLTQPFQNKMSIIDELNGCISSEITLDEARAERLSKI